MNKYDIIENMSVFNLLPYESNIIIRLEETCSSDDFKTSFSTDDYGIHIDSVYVRTASEEMLKWKRSVKVKTHLTLTRNEYEITFKKLNVKALFLLETFLWNKDNSSYIAFVGDITDDPEDENVFVKISKNTPMVKIAIFKNKEENADEINVIILENLNS